MGFSEFVNFIKDRLGMTPERRIEKLGKQGKAVLLLAYLDAPEENLKIRAIETLEELACARRIPDADREQVLDRLDPEIQIRQRLRIRDCEDSETVCEITANEYLPEKNFEMAKFALEYLLQLNPDQIAVMNNLALAYALSGDEKKARTLWSKVLKQNPDDPTALELFAQSLFLDSRRLREDNPSDPAVEAMLLRCLEIHPEYTDAAYLLAQVYCDAQRWEEAEAYFGKCLLNSRLPGEFTEAAAFFGAVYEKIAGIAASRNDHVKAADFYGRALKVNRRAPEEQVRLEESLARCLEKKDAETPAETGDGENRNRGLEEA